MFRLVWVAVALVAILATATLPVVQAATCSESQVLTIYSLYHSAARRSGCAPYASVSPGGAVNIKYTCATTSCLPTLEQLARQLPDCELPTEGVNKKRQVEYNLYTTCKLCTDTQDAQIKSSWQAAAQTSACDEYARSSSFSTSFSWPCSASSCTAVLEDLAGKVPDCFTGTVNEKNRILRAVNTCKSTTPVRTPAPVTTSSGVSAAPTTTPPPTSRSPSTSTAPPPRPPSSAGSSGGTGSNSDACSESQTKDSAALWEAAAKTSACSSYATVTASQVFIRWPCSSSSCTSVMETLGDKLPSCVLPGSTKSEKATLQASVKTCRSGGGSTNNSDPQKDDNASNTGGSDAASTPTPTPSFSSTTCTTTQVKGMASQYVATATGSECKAYSTVTSFRVSIYAPCSSSCVTKSLQTLASGVPDCYYSYDAENKKKQLMKALAICSGDSRSRELRTAASSSSSTSSSSGKYVSLSFGSSSTIGASASVTAAPPAVSRASRVGGTQQSWLMAVVVASVAFVASFATM